MTTSLPAFARTFRRQWEESREESDRLFALVRPEHRYERPIAERHRIAFYIGHLEAFDWNLLRGEFGLEAFAPELDRLFAFGIDPVDGELPQDREEDWPRMEAIVRYGERVRYELTAALERLGTVEGELATRLQVALEHRWMHVETLSYLLHRMPYEAKVANREPDGGTREGGPSGMVGGMVEIPAGAVTLGIRRGEAFGWDNEFEATEVAVGAFRIDRFKVTNGEYAEFVADGGYKERRWWTAEAWDWKRAEGIRLPAFWRREGEGYVWRGMFAEVELPLDGPVYVSQAEASAYACWKGKRLPTEAEWQRAAYGSEDGERAFPWGEAEPAAPHGIGGEIGFAPWAVDAHPAGQSAWGVWGMVGNGWEWTQTAFGPLPGFAAYSFYPGYSADFFDGKHFVLKGGSRATKPGLLRRSFRNWFQAHYQYTYSGFRCAETV